MFILEIIVLAVKGRCDGMTVYVSQLLKGQASYREKGRFLGNISLPKNLEK